MQIVKGGLRGRYNIIVISPMAAPMDGALITKAAFVFPSINHHMCNEGVIGTTDPVIEFGTAINQS